MPSKSTLSFEDHELKIELEVTIEINETKSEKLKLSFILSECTSIEDVSKYFVNGLVKSAIEQGSALKVSLPEPVFHFSPNFIELFAKDVSNILDAKSEKDFSQGLLQSKSSDSAQTRKFKRHASRQFQVKPTIVEKKKFAFKEDSQEIDLTEDIPCTSTQQESSKMPKKPKLSKPKF